MTFKLELNQLVEIAVSGEMGHVKARAEYSGHVNGYQLHYKSADGRALEAWFDEDDILAVEDESNPGQPIYVVKQGEIPPGEVVTE